MILYCTAKPKSPKLSTNIFSLLYSFTVNRAECSAFFSKVARQHARRVTIVIQSSAEVMQFNHLRTMNKLITQAKKIKLVQTSLQCLKSGDVDIFTL